MKEKHDLRGEASEENPAIAVTVVGSRTVTTKELAKEIAASCTIKEADVAGVLTALSQRIQRTLLNGDRVELGDIGTLSVTLTCGNKHRADNVTARDIKVRRIAFAPSKELTQAMRGAEMKSAGPTHTKQLTMKEIEERLTAHFATHEALYRSEVEIEGAKYRAMSNVGIRPSVGGKELLLETHVIDFSGDLYGKHLRICLIEKLRDEKRFASIGDLKEQLLRDYNTIVRG